MRFSRSVLARAAALAVAATLAAPSTAPAAPSGPPIVIGAILSMTGLYAPLGEPERNALQLAEKDINEHGGIAGRPVQINIVDDEGKGDTAAQLATSLIGQNVALIIGGSLTPTSSAIARAAQGAKIAQIYMTPSASIWNTKTGVAPYTFEATPRNELEATKLMSFVKDKLHGKKIALLHDDAPYGTIGAAVATDEAHRQGLDVADDEPFPISSTDVTAQLGRIKASGADTIVIWTASPAAALAVRQIRQLGMNVNIVGSTGIVSDNFLRVAGKDGDGVYSDMDLNVTNPNAAQRAFMTAYRAAYNARPNNFASFAWDAAHIAALALTKTGGKGDGDSVAAALTGMKPYTGATGTFKFSDSDHNGLSAADVHMAIDHGAIWFTL